MKLRLILAALAVLSAWPAAAAPDGVIRGSYAVCDPNNPSNCLAPAANGSLPVSGGGGGSGGGAVYGPNAIGAAPNQPPLFLGYTDAGGLIRGVTPLLELPVHDYDLRASSQNLSAALNSYIDIPLNGDGTVGLRFSGLAASGATVSFFESNDPAVAPTSPINALNASTGVSSATRTTDGDTRIAVAGHTTLRVQVTTAGTGNIAVSYNASEIAGIVDVRSPLPPGANTIGTVNLGTGAPDQTGSNAADGVATSTTNQHSLAWNYGWNGSAWDRLYVDSATHGLLERTIGPSMNAPGTSGTLARSIQGVTNGVPIPGTFADGADTTLGSKADAANAATGSTAMAIFRQIHADLVAPTPAGTAIIGKVGIDQTTPGATNGVYLTNVQGVLSSYYDGAGNVPAAPGTTYAAPRIDSRYQLRTSESGSADPVVGITASTAIGSAGFTPKASAGNLYRAYAVSSTAPAAQQYLVCINATAAPAANAAITPIDFAAFSTATGVGSTASINFGPGPPSYYSTGITCIVTTSLSNFVVGTASNLNVGAR